MERGTESGATVKRLVSYGTLTSLLFGAFLMMNLSSSAEAAPGDPDLGFGTDGKVLTDFSGVGSDDDAKAIVLEPGGKILAAGRSDSSFALARYNPDGSLDTTFGSGGKVLTSFGSSSFQQISALALQSNGRILAAGSSTVSGNFDFALARYNLDGSLDGTFGNGGKVLTNFSATGNSVDAAYALAVEPGGGVVVAGQSGETTTTHFALARYHSDGSLDTTFGNGGTVVTDFGGSFERVFNLALQPGGKILAAGHSDSQFAVARYHPNGSLDTTFGSGGAVIHNFIFGSTDVVLGLVLQPDGKILAAGFSTFAGNTDFAIARYHSDGSLDTSFGNGGTVLTDFETGSADRADAVVLQPGGKFVAGGQSTASGSATFALARYHSDGSLDTTFGNGGKVVTDFSGTGVSLDPLTGIVALVREPDGQIVVAGGSDSGVSVDFALGRYQGR